MEKNAEIQFNFFSLETAPEGPRPLKWLIDVTIGYPENKPLNMQTILAGTRKPCQVVLNYRKFPITDLPLETAALTKWMNDRFVEKEKMLEIFYRTGKFPKWDEDSQCVVEDVFLAPVPVYMSWKKILLANLFYLIVGYATCRFVIYPTFYLFTLLF